MSVDESAQGQDDARISASGGAAGQPDNLPRLLSALELLTEQELIQLNRVIVQRLRLMEQIRAHGQMINLRVGQSVLFTNTAGQTIRGTIARHNRKSVTVVTPDGNQWRVSPSLLRAG